MYAVISTPLDRRTRATLRRAEFGFFGVVVYTRVHTPRRWGEPFRAGVLFFDTLSWRPLRTSCWIVGTASFSFLCDYVWVVLAGRGALMHTPAVGRVARWSGAATASTRDGLGGQARSPNLPGAVGRVKI